MDDTYKHDTPALILYSDRWLWASTPSDSINAALWDKTKMAGGYANEKNPDVVFQRPVLYQENI